jgi:sodium-dependent dicarboxylate transporter 2/3/5
MGIELDAPDTPPMPLHRKIGLWLGPALFFLILWKLELDPQQPILTRMAAVAVLMAVWWITDAIPLAATSLLPVVLFPLLGIMKGTAVATAYMHDIIFLFIGGFLVAIAMERWGLHRRIALRTLMLFGVRPPMILMGFMCATALLSMWISNTATAMMMMPIALAVIVNMEELAGKDAVGKFPIAVLLGIAYGASIGGIATLVGTPPNLVLSGQYSQIYPGKSISFAGWMLFACPLALALLAAAWAVLAVMFRPAEKKLALSPTVFREQHTALGRITREQIVVFVVFTLLAVLWLSRENLKIGETTITGWSSVFANPDFLTDGTVSITLALLLFLIPAKSTGHAHVLDADAIAKVPWNIVLLFGGGFALAAGIKDTGLSLWIGNHLSGLGTLHPLIVVAIVCTVLTFLTEVTSNTATATVFVPILASNADAIGVDPLLLMVPGAVSCSFAFMLPVATPPNAIVFGSDRITVPQMARAGLALNLVGVILTTVAIWLLGGWALGIQ